MFPTKESEDKPETDNVSTPAAKQPFDSIDQFAQWLEADLDLLVSTYAEFETDKSVRTFFKRS